MRKLVICGALVLCALGAGVAAKMYGGIELWLSGNKASSVIHTLVMVKNPQPEDLKRIAADATFPVIFPIGAPTGSHVTRVFYSPINRPSMITVEYGFSRRFHGQILLLDPTQVHYAARPGAKWSTAVYPWRLGSELVVFPKDAISSSDLAQVKAAMTASSPSKSLAEEDALLPRIRVTDMFSVKFAPAERLAPANGVSALLAPEAVSLIAQQRLRGRGVFDFHTTSIVNIPNGESGPDYDKAGGISVKSNILVSPAGVRGIDAVLSFARVNRANCRCEVLFNQPNASTYWVWIIPISGHQAVRKYVVDAATLAVREGG